MSSVVREPGGLLVTSPDESTGEESFDGRYWGIVNCESDGDPRLLFSREDDARVELAARQSLDCDDDDFLDEYHDVYRCDIAGTWWNSHDADERDDGPVGLASVLLGVDTGPLAWELRRRGYKVTPTERATAYEKGGDWGEADVSIAGKVA